MQQQVFTQEFPGLAENFYGVMWLPFHLPVTLLPSVSVSEALKVHLPLIYRILTSLLVSLSCKYRSRCSIYERALGCCAFSRTSPRYILFRSSSTTSSPACTYFYLYPPNVAVRCFRQGVPGMPQTVHCSRPPSPLQTLRPLVVLELL